MLLKPQNSETCCELKKINLKMLFSRYCKNVAALECDFYNCKTGWLSKAVKKSTLKITEFNPLWIYADNTSGTICQKGDPGKTSHLFPDHSSLKTTSL